LAHDLVFAESQRKIVTATSKTLRGQDANGMIDTEPAGNNISGSPSCLADRRTFTVHRAAVAACHSVRKFIVAKTGLRTARRGQPSAVSSAYPAAHL
jgi:hypothetical protein